MADAGALVISFPLLVQICAGVATVYGAWVILSRPVKEQTAKIEKHDKQIAELEKAMSKHDAQSKTVMRALMAICNHMADGNGVETLREVRDDLQREIIDQK